jgi:hypothetical protein
MRILYPVALIIFLLPLFVNAQSNFKPGYVVGLKGDTLKGFIDYREWDKNPTDVRFKAATDNADAKKISPADVLAFGITGFEYYERYSLRISQGQTDVSKLAIGVDTGFLVSNVFLQRIVDGGNLVLYSYKDDIKTRFFIKERTEAKPVELVYQVYLNPADVTQIVNQPRFQNQLYLLAQKYKPNDNKLTGRIELTEYDQPGIEAIINAINGIGKQTHRAGDAKSTRFFAGLGVRRSTANYEGNIALAEGATGKASFSPVAGFGFDLFVNPNVRRLLVRVELSFETAKYQTTTNTPFYAQHTFDQFTGTLTPNIIYNFYNTDAFKFYMGAAASFNFSHYGYSTYRFALGSDPNLTDVYTNYPNMANAWTRFTGKAGIVLNNRVDVYIGYSPYSVVTDHYGNLSGAVNGAQLGINYLFK